METQQVTVCKRCLKPLPVNTEGKVVIKGELCPECIRESKEAKTDWKEKKREFEEQIEKIRGKHTFDGLIMLSGGKDSVYAAYLLSRVYKLKLIAITIDNGFEYDDTFDNSAGLAKKLGISHLIYRLPVETMKKYYKFLLTEEEIRQKDGSQICFFCGRLLKCISIKLAKQLDVGAVFSGHTSEQVRSLGEEKGRDPSYAIRQKYVRAYAAKNYKTAISKLQEKGEQELIGLFEDNIEVNLYDNFIYPLQYFEYKPMEIAELLKREVGWKADTNFNEKYISSGCKLAKIMEYVAYQNGTNTYVDREFNDQIRRGSLTQEDLQEIIDSTVEKDGELEVILEQLAVKKEELF